MFPLTLLRSSTISAMWESSSFTMERLLSLMCFVSMRSSRKACFALDILSLRNSLNCFSHLRSELEYLE